MFWSHLTMQCLLIPCSGWILSDWQTVGGAWTVLRTLTTALLGGSSEQSLYSEKPQCPTRKMVIFVLFCLKGEGPWVPACLSPCSSCSMAVRSNWLHRGQRTWDPSTEGCSTEKESLFVCVQAIAELLTTVTLQISSSPPSAWQWPPSRPVSPVQSWIRQL